MRYCRIRPSAILAVLNTPSFKGYFYFVHSYYVVPDYESLTVGTVDYPKEFCAAILHKNIFAVQFHPEKSHHFGAQLLKNFADL